MNEDYKKAMRRVTRQGILEALRDGRKNRSSVHKPKKGKGSYTRRNKHRKVCE